MRLHGIEKAILTAILVLAVIDCALIVLRGQRLDWSGYAVSVGIGVAMLALCEFYRRKGRAENIALALCGAGLYILFSIVASIFNYLLLPVGDRTIDQTLAGLDRAIGFYWPDYVAWFVDRPVLTDVLGFVYMSSIIQLIAVVLVLGFAARRKEMYEFLLVGLVGVTIAIGVWFVVPSFGTFNAYVLDPVIGKQVSTVVATGYGQELKRLAIFGQDYLSPADTLGLIAFPSFHTVMALMAVWYTRSVRWLFPIVLLINILMLPAILLHGGHHLVDVLGGFAVFALAIVLARGLSGRIEDAGALAAQPLNPRIG